VLKRWRAQVFGGGLWLGNEAQVYRLGREPTDAAMRRVAQETGAPATCFAWRLFEHDFAVRCYSPWGPIRCCGHGLLATAHVLHQYVDVPCAELRLHLAGESAPLTALREASGDARIWLDMPRTSCRSTAVPGWAARAFSCPPMAAAVAGDDSGYWVFEFDPAVDLARLAPDLAEIAKQTQRAVIVTQKTLPPGEFDFLLRYFAPQYGVNEDAVTGSANRVLADYWHGRTGQRQFRALQCSPSGGVVESRLTGGTSAADESSGVAISGRVTLVRA
jgi:predicted PhzF superfamily epimerase YddE/YHI9